MRRREKQTRVTNSRLGRSLAVYRHTFRRARALRFWRVGGVSLLAAGVLGLGVQMAAPPALAAPLSGPVSLADVGSTVAGAILDGAVDGGRAGWSVSTAGDINGDGLHDLLIGAPEVAAGGALRGRSYLVYGQPGGSPLAGVLNLADLGVRMSGASLDGIMNSDQSGRSVSGAGDVNGDGLDDLVIGAHAANAGGTNRGQSYLIYGRPVESPLAGSLNLANVGGALAGATFNGIADFDYSGWSVSKAGDINGDGIDDLVIGAKYANGVGTYRGQSYLIYGQPTGSPLSGSLNLADVGGTLPGAIFSGIENFDRSGWSVSGAGDVNGDGLGDLLIGATGANAGGDDRGHSYLVYGRPGGSPLSGPLDLANVGETIAGAVFNGIGNNHQSGWSVSGAGDVNGDGLDDFLIGAKRPDADGHDRGQSYLVYGQPDNAPLSGSLNLADLGGAIAGATFNWIGDDDSIQMSGISHIVSSAGDVNGDGLDDLLIGSPYVSPGIWERGQTYLIYGQPSENLLSGSLDVVDIGTTVAGATFHGSVEGDWSGWSVSTAGDVNGDGLDDLLIAIMGSDGGGSNQGQTYLVYGRRESRVTWIDPGNDAWDDNLNWLGFQRPVAGDDAFIQPTHGLTASGPTSATQMDSLTLGAQQAGTANLVVDPAGALLIDQTLTIEADGRLAGSGTVTAMGKITNQGEIDLGSQGLNLAGGKLINTGLLRGGGTIDNPLVNYTDGEVRVDAGRQMHLTDTLEQSNAGRIDVVGNAAQVAEIEFDGRLTNVKITGNITATNATLRFNGGLTNYGEVGISFGTSNVFGDINNDGGTIIVSGASNVTFYDDLLNNGTMKVSEGSTAVYFGNISGGGVFPGDGIKLVEGDLSPGNSPGKLTFGGDVVLGANSKTWIELAGTAEGQYDQLLIAGNLQVGGQLQVDLLDGFVPEAGDLFDILDFATLSGNFAAMNLPGLGGGLVWDTSQLSVDGTLCAGACIIPGTGDYNGNGVVDAADYTLWRDTLGSQLDLRADGTGDGTVDEADYVFWNDRFGNVVGTGSRAAVPEPTAGLLFTTGLVGLCWQRERRDG